MTDHKHVITFAQAKAAHARGVEIWTDTAHGSPPWFVVKHLDHAYWAYALDRTPGRALTYEEACVHSDCKLDIDWDCKGTWIKIERGEHYRVPLAETAKIGCTPAELAGKL